MNRAKYVVIIMNIYYLVYILSNIKTIKSKLWYLLLYGESVVSVNIAFLIGRKKLAYVDLMMLHVTVTRIASTFGVVKLIENKVSGFENVDLKML